MTSRTVAKNALHGLELARQCAQLAGEKQAEDVVILDLRGISQLADYFVICAGGSPPQLRAIRDEIQDKLYENWGSKPYRCNGSPESNWIVLDFIDVMVHIFQREARRHYDLERLWSDAARLRLGESTNS